MNGKEQKSSSGRGGGGEAPDDASEDASGGGMLSQDSSGTPAGAGLAVIRDCVKTLPARPGVYRMTGKGDKVLYVGKAKNLAKRVVSYTHLAKLPRRLQRMVAETTAMEIVTTHTEVEALLLESNLIKRLAPRYNVLLRDDKSFPYIFIGDDHQWPQIDKHRGARARKGDYFGPLVVATCRVSAEVEEKLVAKGIQDSKRISDRKIIELARTVRRIADVKVLSLTPATYNRLQGKMGNLNRMLAWAHARVIEDMLEAHPGEKLAIVDQFAKPDVLRRALMERGRKIEVLQEVRAESDPAVAAASIVARDRFLSDLARLSERVGFTLPKGATSVIPAARRAVKEHGREILDEIAKVHFRTTKKVLAG